VACLHARARRRAPSVHPRSPKPPLRARRCSKYGSLQDLKIPRPPEPGAGRVFLVYADGVGAQQAIMQLHGRQFSGRSIQGRLYDEQAFRSGVLTL